MASAVEQGDDEVWKRCSTCRGPIDFGHTFYVCSVSTCNRKRTTYRFCTMECWEEHLPLMRHREAWAVEESAPTRAQWEVEPAVEGSRRGHGAPRPTAEIAQIDATPASSSTAAGAPRRRIRVNAAPPPSGAVSSDEILVVVSRLKGFVREHGGMNTADAVMGVLSNHLRALCLRAVEHARAEGRKTIMDRDFEFLRRS